MKDIFNRSQVIGVFSALSTSVIIWILVTQIIWRIPSGYEMWGILIFFLAPLLGGGFVGGYFASSKKLLIGFLSGAIAIGLYKLYIPSTSHVGEVVENTFDLFFILFGGSLGLLGALFSYGRIGLSIIPILVVGAIVVVFSSMYEPTDPNNRNLYDRGFSSSDVGFMGDLKTALQENEIEFNIYTRDGDEFIGYRSINEQEIERIKEQVEEERHMRTYGRPKDYVELCSGGSSLSSIIDTLENEQINYHLVGDNCIAWPREENELLFETNPHLRELKEAEARYYKKKERKNNSKLFN